MWACNQVAGCPIAHHSLPRAPSLRCERRSDVTSGGVPHCVRRHVRGAIKQRAEMFCWRCYQPDVHCVRALHILRPHKKIRAGELGWRPTSTPRAAPQAGPLELGRFDRPGPASSQLPQAINSRTRFGVFHVVLLLSFFFFPFFLLVLLPGLSFASVLSPFIQNPLWSWSADKTRQPVPSAPQISSREFGVHVYYTHQVV